MLIQSHLPQSFSGDQIEQIRQGLERRSAMAMGCRQQASLVEPALEDESDSTEMTQMGEFDRVVFDEAGDHDDGDCTPIDCFDIIGRF